MPGKPADVNFPYRGLDVSRGYSYQPPGTTPVAVNVLGYEPGTDRNRGSTRHGFSKYAASQLAAGSVQALIPMMISRDQRLGTGDTWGQSTTAGGNDNADLYSFSTGGNLLTSEALGGTNTLGCVDEDGNYYVAAATAGHVYVRKYGTDLTRKWLTDVVPGTGTPTIFGLQVFDGVVYLWAVPSGTGTVANAGIYRLATSDGANSGLWAVSGLATVTGTQPQSFQCLAAGGGILGVVGGSGGALVLQQINIASGTIANTYTLQATLLNHPAKLVTDGGANFYVLTNCTGGAVNKLFKITWAGVHATDFIGSSGAGTPLVSGSNNATDIAYNPVDFQIGVVGNSVFASSGSFAVYNAVTGAAVAAANQATSAGAVSTWHAISADDRGGWRLRRSVAGTNIDLLRVDNPGATKDWEQTTNLGVLTTTTLWLACSGVQVASSPSPMRSNRVFRRLGIVNGGLYDFGNGVANITTNFCSAGAPVVSWAVHNLIAYFADGSSLKTFNASTYVAGTMTATAGTLPGDSNGQRPTLCCVWHGRLVFAGLRSDPHMWWMSAVDAPTDFDYSVNTSIAAVAGNNARAGQSPDVVTCLIPANDDTLIFGCDSSVWVLQGDPLAGGRFVQLSSQTGMAFGTPYCFAPDGTLYFFGSRGGVWALPAGGGKPYRVSQQIAPELRDVNVGESIIRLAWDDAAQGIWLTISPLDATAAARHYFWDSRASYGNPQTGISVGAWFPVEFGDTKFNALAVETFDGDQPEDRVVLFGGRTGYVYYPDGTASTDDGTAINWDVIVGFFNSPTLDEMRLYEMQAELGLGSTSCTFNVYAANTAEAAVTGTSRATGTWVAGRNLTNPVDRAGFAVYIRATGTGRFMFERIRCMVDNTSQVRGRGR